MCGSFAPSARIVTDVANRGNVEKDSMTHDVRHADGTG